MRTPAENQFENNAFFNQIAKQIQSLRQQSYQQQKKQQQIKKIALLKTQANHSPKRLSSVLLKNIVIDFLRSQNMNYTYSVFLREGDILSSEVKNKSQILNSLGLKQMYDSSSLVKISIVQMMLERLGELQTLKKESSDQGIQVELMKQDKTVNNMFLNQLAITAVRRQVQEKEKKHFQSNLQALKKSLTGSIRMQLKKQFDEKLKNTRIEYEKQVQTLKQKTKQILVLNPKLNPKIEEYVVKIGALQTSNMDLNSRIKILQKQKITHNCFKMAKIVQKQKELDHLTKQVQKRKQQYQFALKTLHTSVQNIASQKQAVQPPKQTDLFLTDLKNRKNTKQFMIDQMYGRMLVMDKRIQSISSDNTSLRESNRQLTLKNNQLQQQIITMKKKYSLHSQTKQQAPKLMIIKPKQKSVLIGVCPDDFKVIKKEVKQNVIDQISSQQSGDDDSAIDRKATLKLQINRIHSQLQMNKNKLRLFVENFQ